MPGASFRHEASKGLSADRVLPEGGCAATAYTESKNCFPVKNVVPCRAGVRGVGQTGEASHKGKSPVDSQDMPVLS